MPLPNSLYDEIMRAYERRQLDNEFHLQQRYTEVFEKIPEIKELDRRISELSLHKARLYLDGDEDALKNLQADLHLLSAEKLKLLTAAGYPADYLERHYTCTDCRDTGYIGNRKCHCFRQAEIALLYSQSNLGSILTQENFSAFRLDFYPEQPLDPVTGRSPRESARIALTACQRFVRDFARRPGNLLLYGDTGVGKTFLSHCIAKELIDDSHAVIYLTAAGLFDALAKTIFEKKEDEYHIYDCDLLIIDDLGTELVNSFTSSQLFVCINERLLRNKATLISTNLALDQLKSLYSERIFSRLSSNYTLLKLTGDDIRLKKKLAK